MRQERRILIIIEVLKSKENRHKLLEFWFKPSAGTQMKIGMPYYEIPDIENMWDKHLNFKEISDFWTDNPDLRLPQVLINLSYIQNFPGVWYYREDEETMTESGILEAREIYFWGQNYTKEGIRLEETNWVLVKDLSTEHINAILRDYEEQVYDISDTYFKVFKEELKRRGKW